MPGRRRDPSDRAAAAALVGVAPLASRWIERILGGLEPPLTLSQYLALRAIARDDVSAVELARRTGVTEASVSQLLAGLGDHELVERTPSAHDRRRLRLALTVRGATVLQHAESLLARRMSPLLAELAPPDREALAVVLPRLEAVIGGTAPPRRAAPPPRRPPPPRPGRRSR
jgi:DNA-binding MarR family transcriptional regulator